MNLLQGGLGAILDVYKKASEEFISVLGNVSSDDFVKIVDAKTSDEDCRSIQTITRHVIRSGYGYANYILNALNIFVDTTDANKMKIETSEDASNEIRKMLKFNIHNLYEVNREKVEANMFSIKFTTRWKEEFNFEQILEHAIVHVLRHRRQVEKFISSLKN
ncbi:MAG TPA: DinB family protein [Ignavibacteriaceae bacterium]